MLLSAEEIRACLTTGQISLTPFGEAFFKQGSYSFTLGDTISYLKSGREYTLGESIEYEQAILSSDGYLLKPGEFAIFYTKEKITLSSNILCLLSTRGSVGKMGIDMLQSSLVVEPGSDQVLALETYNHGPCSIRMIPGIPIVKGIFFRIKESA